MSRYAVIRNSLVVNVIHWDGNSDWQAPDDHAIQVVADDAVCGPGYSFDGTNFVEPPGVRPVELEETAEPEKKFELPAPDPLTYNAVGYTTVAQGPLETGRRCAVSGKPGLWLIGDKIPAVEAYSVTRVA